MIRYWEPANSWISGKNPDGQGMPTTNLEGDRDICTCTECMTAWISSKGTNIKDLPPLAL